jgi:hypothetical protein
MAAPLAFEFTLCEVADGRKIAAKRFVRQADGSLAKLDYDFVTMWRFKPITETSLVEMADRLRALALQPGRMIVMGAPASGLDLRCEQRRWSAESRGEAATLRAAERAWLPLDFDDVAVPQGLGRAERMADAALHVRDTRLPEEFRNVRVIAVPSARTGMVGDDTARVRLFVALDRRLPLASLNTWAKDARAYLDLSLDPRVVQAGQPIYTARPLFEGMEDPVPRSLHATILAGDTDTVSLVVDRFKEKVAVIEASVARSAASCGGDWKRLLDATVGGPAGFFEPPTRGIGLAVRVGAPAAEVEVAVGALLMERADKQRQRAYGSDWVRRSIRSFRAKDVAKRAAYQREFARIFQNGV